MTRLEIANDQTGMNWVHSADNRQFPWVGPEFGWGLGTVKVDGGDYTLSFVSAKDESMVVRDVMHFKSGVR